jgi:phosphotransacetylase
MTNHSSEATPRNKKLIDQATAIKKDLIVGVVSPTTKDSLEAVILANQKKLITPILFGLRKQILQVAKEADLDVSGYECVDAKDAVTAAKMAIQFAREGKVNSLMKGDIHTEEIMREVVARESGLRTDRRVSHCLLIDVPSYPKQMIFSDVAINIAPDISMKKDIVQNAINFMHALGVSKPNVAILAAVETVSENIQATLDAAVLCKMAERGQITGGILDGPISIDLAISKEAMQIKRFQPVLPDLPDIFISPDLNAGNIAVKILDYLAGGQSAGIVVGAKVPIILMRRSSPAIEHLLSCALAKIYCDYHG